MKDWAEPQNCPTVPTPVSPEPRESRTHREDSALSLPIFNENTTDAEVDDMARNARHAADFLKALGHESRLMILCHLSTGEKSVTELEHLLSARQAAVSQQLMRLRQENLVTARREGKQIFYSLTDERCIRVMNVVYELFCT